MHKAGKTEIDLFTAKKVKEFRLSFKVSQAVLAIKAELPVTFITKVENPKLPTKYNLDHLNKIAKIFSCSPKDFLPEDPI